jgi:hypothetical protein
MANIFPNYLQRAAAEIAKASQTKRLELAFNYAQTINDLPRIQNAEEASVAIKKGAIVNGSVYYNDELRTLAVAKEQKLK